MIYLLLLALLWKPIYYTFMMVVHSLHPSGTSADDYVGKLLDWAKDVWALVSPSS